MPNAASGSSSVMKKAFPHVDLQGNDLPPSPAPSSPHAGRRYNIATELVFTEGNDQYNASSVPIYQVRSDLVFDANSQSEMLMTSISRVLPLSRHPAAEAESTTTPGLVTQLARTSSDIWRRSCRRSAPLLYHLAWPRWTSLPGCCVLATRS